MFNQLCGRSLHALWCGRTKGSNLSFYGKQAVMFLTVTGFWRPSHKQKYVVIGLQITVCDLLHVCEHGNGNCQTRSVSGTQGLAKDGQNAKIGLLRWQDANSVLCCFCMFVTFAMATVKHQVNLASKGCQGLLRRLVQRADRTAQRIRYQFCASPNCVRQTYIGPKY